MIFVLRAVLKARIVVPCPWHTYHRSSLRQRTKLPIQVFRRNRKYKWGPRTRLHPFYAPQMRLEALCERVLDGSTSLSPWSFLMNLGGPKSFQGPAFSIC